MITIRIPTRISILGGGSDVLPSVLRKYGIVLGCGLSQYIYVNLRYLPPYQGFKTRITYSDIELCQDNADIRHKVVNAAIRYFAISDGLEISYLSDLPAKSGLATSSAFVVGLMMGLAELLGLKYSKKDILDWSINLEQNYLNESIGLQDSAWATMGGLAYFKFKNVNDIEYRPFMFSQTDVEELQSYLLLFYTKISRTSSEVASKYYPSLRNKVEEMDALIDLTHQGIEAMRRREYMTVGRLMGESWNIKKSLHQDVSSPEIDDIIKIIKDNNGYAKLTGSGSGGSILCFCHRSNREKIKKALSHLIEIPVRIDFEGAKIIQGKKTWI